MDRNPYLHEILELMKGRFDAEAAGMSYSEWLCKHTRHPKRKGQPFSFDRYPFQRALVDDEHNNQVVIKPSQVGVSEIFQRLGLAFLKRNPGTKLIYAYPDDDMRKKNVQSRVMPILNATPVFESTTGDKPIRSIELLQIEESFMYMTGSKVGDATSTDADAIFLDEYDLHDMAIAALFSSRLQNSEWKIKKYFSTPTFTQFGVDKLFTDSDQMHYMIKCDACNHWQFPMFTPNWVHIPGLSSDINDLVEDITQSLLDNGSLDLDNSHVCCERCRAPLDLGRESNRAWVAKHPSRTHLRGRKINPFSVATRPVKDIVGELIDYKRREALRGFKNSVLGEPEDSSTARLADADIEKCKGRSEAIPYDPNYAHFIGMDMGHTCHIVIGRGSIQRPQVCRMLTCAIGEVKQKILELDAEYHFLSGCGDRHPESQTMAEIRDSVQRRILPAEYRGTKEIGTVSGPLGPEDVIHLQIDRTMALDEVARAVRMHAIEFNGYSYLWHEIPVHLRNMIRVEKPETPATWEKLDPNDHFFHATAFMLTAMKARLVLNLKQSVPQTFIGIAGVNMPGYNKNITGEVIRPSVVFNPLQLR